MAIDAYYGKPRNGKSYSVVANVLIPALTQGRNVYTNIPLRGEFEAMPNYNTFENDCGAGYFPTIPAGSVIVIDEAWKFFPAGERVTAIPDDIKEFLAMHGHKVDASGNTTQIVIISQTPSQIGTFIKGLVQNAYKVTKKGEKQFRTDQYSGDGAENLKGEVDSSFFTKFDTAVFDSYKTATSSATGFAGNEKKIDKRGGIGSHFLIRWGLPLALIMVIGGVYKGYEAMTNIGSKPPEVKIDNKVTTRANEPVPVATRINPVPEVFPISQDYNLQGWSQYQKNGPITIHVRHKSGMIYPVPSHECTKYFDSYTCVVGGELVTPTSGTPDHVYNIKAISGSVESPI